jgi:hypothetical protein
MMPIVKEEHPGLRLRQYDDRIFEMWKKVIDSVPFRSVPFRSIPFPLLVRRRPQLRDV